MSEEANAQVESLDDFRYDELPPSGTTGTNKTHIEQTAT
jgi:hypothetical protein